MGTAESGRGRAGWAALTRICLAAAVLAVVTTGPSSAHAQTALQGGAHGGAECFERCELTAAAVGFTGFSLPTRALALGVLAELATTENEWRTDTVRVGGALRVYPFRGGLLEPYAQLALGPSWFRVHHGSCTSHTPLFAQLAAGLELRVVGSVFVGIAGTATASAWVSECTESDATQSAPPPSHDPRFGAALTLRFGPAVESD